MTQITNLKYMEPEQAQEPVQTNLSTPQIEMPVLPTRPIFQVDQVTNHPVQNQTKIDHDAMINENINVIPVVDKIKPTVTLNQTQPLVQPITSHTHVNPQPYVAPVFAANAVAFGTVKTDISHASTVQPPVTAKTEYKLLDIYQKLFRYFASKILKNRVASKTIDSMQQVELRAYADKLLVRNQELNAYKNTLEEWASKFGDTSSLFGPENISGNNKPDAMSRLRGFNKPVSMNMAKINLDNKPKPRFNPGLKPQIK